MNTYIHILKCLLHYHERMMMGMVFSEADDKELCNNAEDGKCAKIQFADNYADALREAIRCIEIVQKDELEGNGKKRAVACKKTLPELVDMLGYFNRTLNESIEDIKCENCRLILLYVGICTSAAIELLRESEVGGRAAGCRPYKMRGLGQSLSHLR